MHVPEDIVFCIDTDVEIESEMKTASKGLTGQNPPRTRLDAIRLAISLFVHAKRTIDKRHRFAMVTFGEVASWHLRGFTNDDDVILRHIKSLMSTGHSVRCDFFSLFKMMVPEARHAHNAGRTLRLIIIYNRSSVVPEMSAPWADAYRLFTCDAVYLHEKPDDRTNQPQVVFDALLEHIERVSQQESYIFESTAGLARVLFKNMCTLLGHPMQRLLQDDYKGPFDLSSLTSRSQSPGLPSPANNRGEEGRAFSTP